MTDRSFSSSEALLFGWRLTKEHFTSLFLALGVLTLLLGAAETSAQRSGQGLLHVLLQVASMLVTMGWWRITLRLHDGKPAGLAALSELTVASVIRYFLTIFLFWVAVVVGLVFLVVPGIYLASRLFLAPTLVIDEGLEPIAALRRSYELTDGAVIEVLVLAIFLFGINLVGAMLLGLGLLASIPTSFLAVVYAYRQLAARRPAQPTLPRLEEPSSAVHS